MTQRPRGHAALETGRASIRDVAARAGVSVTTVSHALNGTRFVSPDATARVQEAAHALGYVPSVVARGLKQNTTRTLGMLVPNNSNPYFAEIIRGVEHECYGAGYSLVLANSNDDPQRQVDHLRVLAERRVDGIVLVASGEDADILASCKDLRLPLVLLDREIDGLDADLIEVDHAGGAALATAHLLGLGHPRVACIGGLYFTFAAGGGAIGMAHGTMAGCIAMLAALGAAAVGFARLGAQQRQLAAAGAASPA